MRIIIYLFTFCLLCNQNAQAQHIGEVDYGQLVKKLEESALSGNKKAIRDLATLVDKPIRTEVINTLKRITLFSAEEFDLNGPVSRKELLKFYYEHEQELRFSELVGLYFLSSFEDRKVEYKTREPGSRSRDKAILLRTFIYQLTERLESQSYQDISPQLQDIARLDRPEGFQFILDLIADERIRKLKTKDRQIVYDQIALCLSGFPSMESLEAILGMIDGKMIDGTLARPLLARVCNLSVDMENAGQLSAHYQQLIDSLGSLEALRTYGYEKEFDFRMNYFQFAVDYFGKILNLSAGKEWLRANATRDLTETYHPRSLFYLATQAYKHWYSNPGLADDYIQRITLLTQLEVGLIDSLGQLSYEIRAGQDERLRLHYLLYWSGHYKDYNWDPHNGYFVNKYTVEKITRNYERLFRRLNSRNDSVALQSFLLLTEGNPTDVISLASKYKQLLRTYNASLPSFKYAYLEQLSQLTEYCRRNGYSYQATAATEKLLQQLINASSPGQRYQLENQLIDQLQLGEISALEYWACIYEGSPEFSFSAGRILDRFYSKNWDQIVRDDGQLLLYLKKAHLFEDIGVFGSCNNYLVKFDITDPQLQSRLNTLLKIETDEGIISQISRLIVLPEAEEEEETLDFNSFLQDAVLFNKRDIKVLPPPGPAEIEKVVQAILETEDMAAVRQYFYYLRLYPSIEMVPQLFRLVEDQRVVTQRKGMVIRVSDLIVPSLEGVYNYHFPPEDELHPFATGRWKELWETNGENYRNWIRIFFEQKLDSLRQAEELVIEDINLITESPHYTSDYKTACLEALPKVRPFKDIRKLNIKPRLAVRTDLQYFEDFFFSYKELDDLPKLFNVPPEDTELMLDYLERKSANFSLTERGSFYNNLFRSDWFGSYINRKDADTVRTEKIRAILITYLDESDYLSEFEEQVTNLHIAQIENIGRSLEEKLLASTQIEADPGSRAKIRESIISTLTYPELGTAVQILAQIEGPQASETLEFLSRDFGIPVFDLDQTEALQEFLEKHRQFSEYDFYHHYLNKFGVDFTGAKGKPDYQKIYNILRFEIITPFVSRTGGKRDYYTYGIIKLLELHFKTRLGFHEKLNENQTFYTFTSQKRALAWIEYLEEKKLVNQYDLSPPSFSQVRKND